jgi:hypothetical protein
MASKVYVTEFQGAAVDSTRHYVPIADASGSTTENASSPITSGASHAESAAFSTGTTYIRVHNDSGGPICVLIGTTPVATTNNARMSSDQTEYFGVKAGDKISVIATT